MIHQLALGCHNLTAGSSTLRSRRLVRAALDLGITKFDVAPSYGLGTAEDALSDALGRDRLNPTIRITTKFGIPRPRHSSILAWLREPVRLAKSVVGKSSKSYVAPLNGRSPNLEADLVKSLFTGTPELALKESLRRLRIECVDSFLTHENIPPDTIGEISELSERWKNMGLISQFGFSGNTQTVLYYFNKLQINKSVLQFSVMDAFEGSYAFDIRHFNLSRLAEQLNVELLRPHNCIFRAELVEGSKGQFFADRKHSLALSLAAALVHYPERSFILNASNADRLTNLICLTDYYYHDSFFKKEAESVLFRKIDEIY